VLTSDADAAVAALAAGSLVVLPTETVYGLAADASNPAAVARVFALKGRPPGHPVIVHVAGAAQLERWATRVPAYAHLLVSAFWPGPLTLVLPRATGVPDEVTGGADTVGVRAPAHPLTHEVLDAFAGGVAAPSANRFGRVSPTTAQHALDELGAMLDPDRDLVLDGGPCRIGVESTIVDATGSRPRLLRPGAVSVADVAQVTGLEPEPALGAVTAPGTLPAHYAPAARVVCAEPDTATASVKSLVASGQRVGVIGGSGVDVASPDVTQLAEPDGATAYAHELYAALRLADRLHLDVVVAVLPPDSGIGAAVRDRLRRAEFGSRTPNS
jgi:L-threonylcarbamoyladenylate synthase